MKKPIVHKKYLRLYEETARQKVLEVLFRFPDKEFSLSDLAKEASVAKANIGKILLELEKWEFISVTRLSKIWRIMANRDNWDFKKSKIIYNLNFVYKSGLVEFLIDYFKNPKCIVLFGSFGKGEDIASSDIDIAIENENSEGYKVTGLRELLEFEKIIRRNIQLHLFNQSNVDEGVFNNIINGVVLFGFLEVNHGKK
ncbi:MAG: nucleotidyltransferase domain-containing protein [Nanoarchaeota archaeon]